VQTVVETESFVRDARATGVTDNERLGMVDFMAANPEAGKEIRGTVLAVLADAYRRRK
jgi:hypothetical protein